MTDFRLSPEELALFRKNGFVVSQTNRLISPHPDPHEIGRPPLEATTLVDYYYGIWADDMPVLITTDSVLDAWHQTFQTMLEDIEELILYPALREMLIGNRKSIRNGDTYIDQESTLPMLTDLSDVREAWAEADSPSTENIRQAIRDLELYLGTAELLALGYDTGASSDDLTSPAHWYRECLSHSEVDKKDLCGDKARHEDMTLFEPRGHYANSQALSAYFRTILWLSRAQFHVASSSNETLLLAQRNRELRAAILLALQVRDRNFLDEWTEIETFMQSLVGQPNAMTIVEFLALLEDLSLDRVSSLASDSDLNTIRQALLNSTYGIQEVDGGRFEPLVDLANNCNLIRHELPRALSLFSQRWTPDA